MQRLDTSFVNHRQQLRQGLKASASPMIPLINPILKQETNRLLTKLSDLLQLNPRKSKIASHCHSYLTRYRNDTETRYTGGDFRENDPTRPRPSAMGSPAILFFVGFGCGTHKFSQAPAYVSMRSTFLF
jgi:hypothetical protein